MSVVDCNVQWMSRFSTDTRCRWGIGALFLLSKRFLFLAWHGAAKCGFRAIDLRPNPNRSLFSKNYKGLKKKFHYDEKIFSTKRKFCLDIPKLQYFPIGTRVLAAKYCNTGMQVLNFSKTRFPHCVVQNCTDTHRVCVQ